MRVLVIGATGYIGGRLIPRLLAAGHAVTILTPASRSISGRQWREDVTVRTGDLLKPETLEGFTEEIDCVYYLVHALGTNGTIADYNRRAANNFVRHSTDTIKIIYLGGLQGDEGGSALLLSRTEVGDILRAALPTTEFRTGIIIGSGSALFEMIRDLTERLPILVTPRWINSEIQPIGVEDVLRYLLAALDKPALGVVDIGSDVQTYRSLIQCYAKARELNRMIIASPFLAPPLANRWMGLVASSHIQERLALTAGSANPLLADTKFAIREFPNIVPEPCDHAISIALRSSEEHVIETRWSDHLENPTIGETGESASFDEQGYVKYWRVRNCAASPDRLFAVVKTIGGSNGYFSFNWVWAIRGLADQILGGSGMSLGRRHKFDLYEGESFDFWQVDRLDEGSMLLLRAEMKAPGKGYLKFEVGHFGSGGSRLKITALFKPKGLAGFLYCHSSTIAQKIILNGMSKEICRRAEEMKSIPEVIYPVELNLLPGYEFYDVFRKKPWTSIPLP